MQILPFQRTFKSCEILNVYKLKLLNTAVFMHKIKSRTAPSLFLANFEQPSHSHPARFSSGYYRKPQIKLCKCRFWISIRGPAIWIDLVKRTEKDIKSSSIFKTKIKIKLLNLKMKWHSFNTFAFKRLTHRKHRLMVTKYYDHNARPSHALSHWGGKIFQKKASSRPWLKLSWSDLIRRKSRLKNRSIIYICIYVCTYIYIEREMDR